MIDNQMQQVPTEHRLILVFYINIGNTEDKDVPSLMKELIARTREQSQNEERSYWFPTREGESRVECINPQLINNDQYKEVRSILDRNQKIVDELIDQKLKGTISPRFLSGFHISKMTKTIRQEFQEGTYLNDKKTRQHLKERIQQELGPDIIVKCDEENNPSSVIDSNIIIARVTWINLSRIEKYIDLTFGQ